MIHLRRFPEPGNFDCDVRRKGLAFLQRKGIRCDGKVDAGIRFPPYWNACRQELYSLYKGYCAYTCFRIHEMTGVSTVEHIKPKRRFPMQAYEWRNYCLACARINSRKGEREDLINPFDVVDNLFTLKLNTGFMNADEQSPLFEIANRTISSLDLNNPKWCKARQGCVLQYVKDRENGLSVEAAKERLLQVSIFVWLEAERQGFLK